MGEFSPVYLILSGRRAEFTQFYRKDTLDGLGRIYRVQGPVPEGITTREKSRLDDNTPVITLIEYSAQPGENGTGIVFTEKQRTDWNDDNTENWYWKTEYHDAWNRTYRTISKGKDSDNPLVEKIEYNNRGLVEKQSLPFYATDDPVWVEMEYNINGILLSTTQENVVISITPEDGGKTLTRKIQVKNAGIQGTTVDSAVGRINLVYHSAKGNARKVLAATCGRTVEEMGKYTALVSGNDMIIQIPSGDYNPARSYYIEANTDTGYVQFFIQAGTANLLTQATTIKLDSRGNILQRLEILNADTNETEATTVYQYNPLGYLTQVQDGVENGTGGITHNTGYDSLMRKIHNENPDTGSTVFHYNEKGLLASRTDANGKTITYAYDNLGRLVQKNIPDKPETIVNFYYDDPAANAAGKLSSVEVRENGIIKSGYRYTYDTYGLDKSVTVMIDGELPCTFTQFYDTMGRTVNSVYPDQSVFTTTYSADGNIDTLSMGEVTYADYNSFTALGQPREIVYGNQVRSGYTYLNGKLDRHTLTK